VSTGTATLTPQRALEIGKPRVGRPAAQQQFMGNGRLVPAAAAGGLDQMPGPQVFQPEIVARRLVASVVRSLF
jgi:hypothetical protein